MTPGKAYIVEIPKLKLGTNEQEFEISRPFFERFNFGPVQEGELKVHGVFKKYASHIDARFRFEGTVTLHCDRCTEPYLHQLDFEERIIFSYEAVQDPEHDEIIQISREDIEIDLGKDFYDFIMLQVPLRKVPAKSVHECPPEVLKLVGEAGESEAEEIDPPWAELQKLKEKFKDN